MQAKEFTFKIISIFTLSYLALFVLYYAVNPQQEFESSITDKKFFYSKEYSRKQFEELKNSKNILVFGTSQSHMISSEMMSRDVLNLHNLYGETGDIINFLKQLKDHQINNIEKIIYMIDLRAGMWRKDTDLIDYSQNKDFSIALNIKMLKHLFLDIKQNILGNYESFLQPDGSAYYLDHDKYVKSIDKDYGNKASMKYDNHLIDGIVWIDDFAKKHDINIKYITPVTNDKYFKIIDFDQLYVFYSKLIDKNIMNLNLYYYIEGFSDIKNDQNEYISFGEYDHMNRKFVTMWLHDFILQNTKFTISNKNMLQRYIADMKSLQQ